MASRLGRKISGNSIPRQWLRCGAPLVTVAACLLFLCAAGASCLNEPPIVPPPPVEELPATVTVPDSAVQPPADYDPRLKWDYQRLIDADLVKSFAGESDYTRDVRFRAAGDVQRLATIDLLVAVWQRDRPAAAHVREAILRLLSDLAPADPRTTTILLAGLDDIAMKVRFRANNRLRELYSTDVNFDPNEIDPVIRSGAIARWKKAVEAGLPADLSNPDNLIP